jgi:ATPase subunit of ABC transporter with duplicated ATPase domains
MAEPLIRTVDLVAGYGVPVVGPFSLRMEAGDVIGLSGPNGSGKSTLLKAIANGARIFSGQLEKRPGLTLAWQQQQPVDEMPFSGIDYLRYAQADRISAPPRLAGWMKQRVDSLSGGQFQLLSVWVAIAGDAELVLLDEPTNNLDPQGEDILVETLKGGLEGRAVLIVSHERPFLERACSRVLEVGA